MTAMFHEEKSGMSFDAPSPKISFIIGLVAGVLVICTIGFFILLGVVLKGGGVIAANNNDVAPSQVVADDLGGGAEPVGEVKAVTKDDHIRGKADAKVTLIEYSDFQCPFCQRFHPTMQQVIQEYGDKVRWVYRHYPLSFHPEANPSANAAECASEQGKFWEYGDALIANQTTLGTATYQKIRDDLKLNKKKFDDCFAAKKYNARILADEAGGNAAGVTGTPGTIVMNDKGFKQLIPGALPYDSVKTLIDQALAQ
jgi:protein-disulfide isomerase